LGVIFADPLAQLFLSSMAREKTPGTARECTANISQPWKPVSKTAITSTFSIC